MFDIFGFLQCILRVGYSIIELYSRQGTLSARPVKTVSLDQLSSLHCLLGHVFFFLYFTAAKSKINEKLSILITKNVFVVEFCFNNSDQQHHQQMLIKGRIGITKKGI